MSANHIAGVYGYAFPIMKWTYTAFVPSEEGIETEVVFEKEEEEVDVDAFEEEEVELEATTTTRVEFEEAVMVELERMVELVSRTERVELEVTVASASYTHL